jgi:hypothetical protein
VSFEFWIHRVPPGPGLRHTAHHAPQGVHIKAPLLPVQRQGRDLTIWVLRTLFVVCTAAAVVLGALPRASQNAHCTPTDPHATDCRTPAAKEKKP